MSYPSRSTAAPCSADVASPPQRWPVFQSAEIEAVVRVLRSGRVNYWTGDEGRQFECEFAAAVGQPHAIAVANGTLALELCLVGLGIGAGDEVVVPSRTFIATASCVVARGARPVVCDVDRNSQNLTAATVLPHLSPRTRAIVAVHLAGWPCDMEDLRALADARGVALIEDCAQAIGATLHGRSVGSWGTVAAFSFCQDKIITTAGEGGMVVTADADLWKRMWAYKDHGKDYDTVQAAPKDGLAFQWLHHGFGTNWRMTEIQSAMGRVLLLRLPEFLAIRRHHAQQLEAACRRWRGLRITPVPTGIGHAYYKYYCFVEPAQLRPGWSRDRILSAIRERGIHVYSGSCSEIYRESAFPPSWRPDRPLPVARELGETALMFLVDPSFGATGMQPTCAAIDAVLEEASMLREDQ